MVSATEYPVDSPARQMVRRSSLIMPVNVPAFVEKAHLRGADAICLDLEDSIPPRVPNGVGWGVGHPGAGGRGLLSLPLPQNARCPTVDGKAPGAKGVQHGVGDVRDVAAHRPRPDG